MSFLDFSSDSEDVKRIKNFYSAVERGDFSSARQYLDYNLEWVGPEARELWYSGTHRGVDAVFREVFEPSHGKFANFRMRISKFFEVGNHIFVLGRVTGRTKMTGRDLDAPMAHVWTLGNGKAVRCEAFEDTRKWLEALGEVPPAPQTEAGEEKVAA